MTSESPNHYNETRESLNRHKEGEGVKVMSMKKRMILAIPEELEKELVNLKETVFSDISYSEMYRQLLRMGLDVLKEKKGEEI